MNRLPSTDVYKRQRKHGAEKWLLRAVYLETKKWDCSNKMGREKDMEEKRHRIIGTAGHIDHGKTWLVKALTGTRCV